jgi:hypothetical protein
MADLRLLAALAMACALLHGCSPRLPAEIVTPRLAGYVIDPRTGEGIAGAELFVYRAVSWPQLFHRGVGPIAARWTTSDERGYFDLPEYRYPIPEEERKGSRLSPSVFLRFIHHDYGARYLVLPESREGWASLRFEVEPHPEEIRWVTDPGFSGRVCGVLPPDAYRHCCEVAYGDPSCD